MGRVGAARKGVGKQVRQNRIVLLGTGGGPAMEGRPAPGTSALLDMDGRRIVIDCGLGVTAALAGCSVDLASIDTICVTHLHAGHVLELGPLLHGIWTAGRLQPVSVWGPAGIEALWRGFLASLAYDAAIRSHVEERQPLADLVVVNSHDEGLVSEGPVSISALRVPHPPLEHCFALRFDGRQRVTFSGDTAFHVPLAEFAHGSAVLAHAAVLGDWITEMAERTGGGKTMRNNLLMAHATVEQAARIARAAKAKRLVLHHVIPAQDADVPETEWITRAAGNWAGPVILGQNGMEVVF